MREAECGAIRNRDYERAPGARLRIDFEGTWVENRSVTLHMASGTGVKAYDQRWELAPSPTGCRFSFEEHVALPFGFVGRLLERTAKGTSERHVAEMLARLKELAEA